MTKEEYIKANQIDYYFFAEQHSEPKYDCPKCKNGKMRKNLSIVLTSYPPKYLYECDNCDHVDYLTF